MRLCEIFRFAQNDTIKVMGWPVGHPITFALQLCQFFCVLIPLGKKVLFLAWQGAAPALQR